MQTPFLRVDWTWVSLRAALFPTARAAARAVAQPRQSLMPGSGTTAPPPQRKHANAARVTLWDEVAPPSHPPLPLPSDVNAVRRGAWEDSDE